jgi:hypothetical protein
VAIARYKDLCIDANNPAMLGPFWARVLDPRWEQAEGAQRILGPTPRHTIWVNRVPERKTVKHRVHLDIYAADLAALEALGSKPIRRQGEGRTWTVMADPEGNEFCAFVDQPDT